MAQSNPSAAETPKVEVLEIPASYADFALAAGLPHDASKGDVLAAMGKFKAEHAKVLDELGAKTADEAVGKISGERSTHASLVVAIVGPDVKNPTAQDAIAKLTADRKAADRAKALELLGEAKAQGKTAGDKALSIFDKHGMEAFQAHLDALTPNAALVGTQPIALPSTKNPAQPAGGTPGAAGTKEIEVVLSKRDLKVIKDRGYKVEDYVAVRRMELQDRADAQRDADDDSDE